VPIKWAGCGHGAEIFITTFHTIEVMFIFE
jgi:hypothetical protein